MRKDVYKDLERIKKLINNIEVEEEKPIVYKKEKPKLNIYDLFKFLFLLSVVFLIGISFQLGGAGILILSLLGSFFFLPIGVIIGWIFLDPFMRAKALRTLTKKNYGLVFLTGRGKNIITKVKNFNDDLIWIGKDKCWHISPSEVKNLNKYEESYSINDENISYFSGVPCLFLDIDSMKPLKFYKEKTPISPEEAGSALMGWTVNQLAKGMFFKRTMEIIFILILMIAIGAAFFAYSSNNLLHKEVIPLLQKISSKISTNVTVVG